MKPLIIIGPEPIRSAITAIVNDMHDNAMMVKSELNEQQGTVTPGPNPGDAYKYEFDKPAPIPIKNYDHLKEVKLSGKAARRERRAAMRKKR